MGYQKMFINIFIYVVYLPGYLVHTLASILLLYCTKYCTPGLHVPPRISVVYNRPRSRAETMIKCDSLVLNGSTLESDLGTMIINNEEDDLDDLDNSATMQRT